MIRYRLPLYVRLFRRAFRPIFRMIFHLLAEVRISGQENIPSRGGYLIAINHVSLFDPPFVIAFWPVEPEAVGAVDIWSRRGQATLARFYGGIPVKRGHYDRALIDRVTAALKEGRPVVIAPEGKRSHQPGMNRALPGVSYIADIARVPVLPVGIVGCTDDFLKTGLRGRRPVVEMHIGHPIELPPIPGKGSIRRRARQENVDLIMTRIAALLPTEYHGVYGS